MYKKLLLLAASASFISAVQASEQATPTSLHVPKSKTMDSGVDPGVLLADINSDFDENTEVTKQKSAKEPQTFEQPISELEAVVVTSAIKLRPSETATPVTVLKDDELTMKMGHTIGETLKQELGIASQSFGPGVGTPVIRGQSGPRVRVLQNGIGSNDVSQLSPDHATSIEPIMAERVEVLRGPATLLYGSGAMGGVVNVIDNRIPTHIPSKPFGADFDQRYDSANNESSTALKTEGVQGSLAYHLDGLYRNRGDMVIGGSAIDAPKAQALDSTLNVVHNTHGFIPNTFAQTLNGSVGVSLLGEPGFAGISFNQLHNTYGVAPDGSGGNHVRIDVQQKKYDFKSELKDPFSFIDSLRMRLGYTDYFHTELDGGVPGVPFAPGTAFSNKAYEGRVELVHKAIGPFKGSVGFQAQSSEFAAFDYTGAQTIVPPSQINSFGVFGMEGFNYGPLSYQLGARVEQSSIEPNRGNNYSSPNGMPIGTAYNYSPVSASISGLWKVDEFNNLNLGFTRSQRAPQVQELLSHGFHDATRSFEEGNPNLQMETSYNLDFGYKFKTDWLRLELDLFNNWINSYIYQQRSGQFVLQNPVTGTGDPCPPNTGCTAVVQTHQAGAIFRGYESKLVFPVMENHYGLLDLTLFSDYTRGILVDGGDVPRMPPLRFGLQWDYIQHEWSGNLRFTRAQAQDHPGNNDTATAGYYLLTVSGQYQIKSYHDAKINLFIKGNNLLNENIRNSVSYLRNFAPEPGRGAEVGVRISY